MGLVWWRSTARSQSPLFADVWSLVQIPIGATLKRVVLSWYIDMLGNDSDSLAFWTSLPIVNTIEVTRGSPPPFPEDPVKTSPQNHDFLHWSVTTMKAVLESGATVLLSTAFNESGVGTVDTNVQRVDRDQPMEVWWSWSALWLQTFPASGALSRYAASCLLDVPDGTNGPFERAERQRIVTPADS